jgi:hypothetical protein
MISTACQIAARLPATRLVVHCAVGTSRGWWISKSAVTPVPPSRYSGGRRSAASGGWPTPSWKRSGLVRHPTGVVQGSSQQHLDVGVEAAEFVGGPPGQSVVHRWIQAQRHLLTLAAHV